MKKELNSFELGITIISLIASMIMAYFWGMSHNAAYAITAVLFGVVFLLFQHFLVDGIERNEIKKTAAHHA